VLNSNITMNGNLEVLSYALASNSTNSVLEMAGQLTGPGSLTVHANSGGSSRLGRIDLTSDLNNYAGVTTIGGGGGIAGTSSTTDRITLSVGNGGSTGVLGTGNVVNNWILQFNRNNAMTVANQISGAGDVNQVGSGTTTLTNLNTYTGITR